MRTRYTFLAVLVFAAAAFSQTSVQPADWSAVNSMTLQTSGKTVLFELRDLSQSVRLSIVDLSGKAVWSRTATPVDGVVSVTWSGASSQGVLAKGVYVARAVTTGSAVEGGRGTDVSLLQRQFAYVP
jgi:hypothetical protein